MTKTMQTVRRAAQFVVSVAGLTLAAPTLADDELPRSGIDMGHSDMALPAAAGAKSHAGRLAREISSGEGNRRETADKSRTYAAQIRDVYTPIDLGRNPALAALAANITELAKRQPTR